MEKKRLLKFIEKYYLGGLCDHVVWTSTGTNLKTKCITEDKTLSGVVELSNIQFPESSLGIYSTDQVMRFINALDETIELDLLKRNDEYFTDLILKDAKLKTVFALSDLAVIPKTPVLQNIPAFDLEIKVNPEFINNFIKSKNALDASNFAIYTEEDKIKFVIGYSTLHSDEISFYVDGKINKSIKPVNFSANYFKSILTANKDCTDGILKISEKGIMQCNFIDDKYKSGYFLLMLTLS